MKLVIPLLFILSLIQTSNAQTQIGQDILGVSSDEGTGESVAISSNGNIVAVGGTAKLDPNIFTRVRVFTLNNNTWELLGNEIIGQAQNQYFKIDLSGDGSILAILDSSANEVIVYQLVNNTWTQVGQTILPAGTLITNFALSSDGQTIAVSNFLFNNVGQVRVLKNINNTWTQIGQDLNGDALEGQNFGGVIDISLDGTILVVSDFNKDGNFQNEGQVKVFEFSNDTWVQIGQDLNGESSSARKGINLSLTDDGSKLAVINTIDDENSSSVFQQVDVYENISNVWTKIGNTVNENLDEDFGNDIFPCSIDLSDDGSTFVIGATSLNNFSGQADVYQFNGTNWSKIGNSIIGDGPGPDQLGVSIALSSTADSFIVGAPFGQDKSYARVFDISQLLSTNDYSAIDIDFYPNPASEYFSLKTPIPERISVIRIYDNLGRLVIESPYQTKIPITNLSTGLYYAEILFDERNTEVLKFIKK